MSPELSVNHVPGMHRRDLARPECSQVRAAQRLQCGVPKSVPVTVRRTQVIHERPVRSRARHGRGQRRSVGKLTELGKALDGPTEHTLALA